MLKRSFTIAGAVLAAIGLMTVAPKAAHAVVAALVQVTNTTANPVPNLDTERNARIPYESASTVNCGVGPTLCVFHMTAVPAGYRLVVQNVNGYMRLGDTSVMPISFFQVVGSNNVLALPSVMGPSIGFINQPLTAYVDQNWTPQVTVSATFGTSFTSQMTVTGYLESCAVTGCPAVQQ